MARDGDNPSMAPGDSVMEIPWLSLSASPSSDTIDDHLQNVDQMCECTRSFGAVSLEEVGSALCKNWKKILRKKTSSSRLKTGENDGGDKVGKHILGECPSLQYLEHALGMVVHT